MNIIDRYKRLLAEVFVARKSGNEDTEDRLLDQMDRLWNEMGKSERDTVNLLGARLASGELSESAFIHDIRSRQTVLTSLAEVTATPTSTGSFPPFGTVLANPRTQMTFATWIDDSFFGWPFESHGQRGIRSCSNADNSTESAEELVA